MALTHCEPHPWEVDVRTSMSRRSPIGPALVLVLVGALAPAGARPATSPAPLAAIAPGRSGDLTLVTPRLDEGEVARTPAWAADADEVAFVSASPVLNPDDPTGTLHVFVARSGPDGTRTITRISQTEPPGCDASEPANGPSQPGGDGLSGERGVDWDPPAISSDGRFIAFATRATNLVAGDLDVEGRQHVVLHDRDVDDDGTFDECGGTSFTLVSAGRDPLTGALVAADGDSRSPTLGVERDLFVERPVVGFASAATNLVLGDVNAVQDVFRWEWVGADDSPQLQMASRLASVSEDDGAIWYQYALPNGASRSPAITGGGEVLSFVSEADNLVEDSIALGGDGSGGGDDDANDVADVFAFLANDDVPEISLADGVGVLTIDGGTAVAPASRTVVVRNVSELPTRVLPSSIIAPPGASMTIVDDGCADVVLPIGGACDLDVVNTEPTGSAVLQARPLGGDPKQVTLAVPVAVPGIAIEPSLIIDIVGGSPATATVTNTGQLPYTVTSVFLGESFGAPVPAGLALSGGNCVGADLAPGGTCTLGLVYDPPGPGVPTVSTPVTVTTDIDGVSAVATFEGRPIPGPRFGSSPVRLSVPVTVAVPVPGADLVQPHVAGNPFLLSLVSREQFFDPDTGTVNVAGTEPSLEPSATVTVTDGGSEVVVAFSTASSFGATTTDRREVYIATLDLSLPGQGDLQGDPVWVSTSLGPPAPDTDKVAPSVSVGEDGRFVAFVARPTTGAAQVYVFDEDLDAAAAVSRVGGAFGDGASGAPSIRTFPAGSEVEPRVAFGSAATNLAPDPDPAPDVVVARRIGTGGAWQHERLVAATEPRIAAQASLSRDGRIVAFASGSGDLVPGDSNGRLDVFVRDIDGATTTRVSVGPGGAQLTGDSYAPSISADGRFVAYATTANIDARDTNTAGGPGTCQLGVEISGCSGPDTDIYVHDRATAQTIWVSRGHAGAPPTQTGALGSSRNPTIAVALPRLWVAYDSDAPNLRADSFSPPVPPGIRQVYVTEVRLAPLFTIQTTLLSRDSGGTPGTGDSIDPSISTDGRYVAYTSGATTIVPADADGSDDIYRADRGAPSDGTFTSDPPATVQVSVDVPVGSPALVDARQASISDDGRHIAYTGSDAGGGRSVYVRDLAVTPSATRLASRPTGGGAIPSDHSFSPAVSGSGQRVAFVSTSDLLSPDDVATPPFGSGPVGSVDPGQPDLFVHDLATDRTELVSVGFDPFFVPNGHAVPTQGVVGDLPTGPAAKLEAVERASAALPDLDELGNSVAFGSDANNWSPADPGNVQDVWRRQFAPELEISVPANFGTVRVGATSAFEQAVVLENVGSGAVLLADPAFTISGAQPGDFVVSPPPIATSCAGRFLAPDQECTLAVVRFRPSDLGPRSATITAAVQRPPTSTPPSAPLAGTGGRPQLTITPNPATFGDVVVGDSSASQTLVVENSGSAGVLITGRSIGGNDPGSFTTTEPAADACVGAVLEAGGSCSLSIHAFTPDAAGDRSAVVTVTTEAPELTLAAALEGRGLTRGIVVEPTPIDFGQRNVGVTSAPQGLRVRNTGTATVTVTGRSLGGANPGDFTDGDAPSPGCTGPLAPGAQCELSVHAFRPTAAGARSATVTVSTDAGLEATATLTGTGVANQPALTVTPDPADFGTVRVSESSANQGFTVRNTGNVAFTVTSRAVSGANASDFALVSTGGCLTDGPLAPGATCVVATHAFRPSSTGARSATLTVGTNVAGLTGSAALTGQGAAAAIAVEPSPVDFGDVEVGGSAGPTVVRVRNQGDLNVTVSGFTVGGDHPGDFVAVAPGSGSCTGLSLAPGAVCSLASVIFTPALVGGRQATITATTTTTGISATGTLGGTGIPPDVPPPEVTPVLEVIPAVASQGDVVAIRGRDFPADTSVLLRWSQGIPLNRTITSDSAGSFTTSVIIFPRDLIGTRELQASFGPPDPVVAPLLVVVASAKPRRANPFVAGEIEILRG